MHASLPRKQSDIMSGLLQLSKVGELQSHGDAEIYRDRLADLLSRHSRSFPGAQPVSFARQHLRELESTDYYLCEKTDGIRCLLYLTFYTEQDGNKTEANFLVDRKNDYYFVNNPHFHFPLLGEDWGSFHTETLLDGELVLDTDKKTGIETPRYLVFDCLALDGKPLLPRTLDKRLGYFMTNVLKPYNELLRSFPTERAEQPFEVVAKKMEKAYGIQMMFNDVLPNLPHGNDGLVFTCRTSEYVTGTDRHIIKWKPPHENTIDFKLQLGLFPAMMADGEGDEEEEPDYDACPEFELLVFKGNGKNEFFAPLHVEEDEWRSMKAVGQMLDGRIIECYKDTQGRWRFKREQDGSPRFRDDKKEANHISTVESVLESIEDAVSEQDLLDHARAINVAWKEREKREMAKQRAADEEMKRKRMEHERVKREQAAAAPN